MISMAVDVARGVVPVSTMKLSLTQQHDIKLGIAPAQGLFLEMSFYRCYNKYKVTEPQYLLDWDVTTKDMNNLNDVLKEWKQFKDDVIMKHVMDQEPNQH